MGLIPPVSNSPTLDDFDQLMTQAKELMARKDNIEQELKELEDVINTSGVTMNESLIDAQGFPRAEIDIHSIRTSRNMIIRLRNDHRQVMADIETILHKIHEAKRHQQQSSSSTTAAATTSQQQQQVPFAIINAVAPDSPAYTAGLRRNDRIIKFGHIHADNNERLQALNILIGRSENTQVPITVMRDGTTHEFTVTPRSGWGGRGTLGCHLLPL